MTTISRDRVVINETGSIPANNFDLYEAPIQPDGEVWLITRILFADANILDLDAIDRDICLDVGKG